MNVVLSIAGSDSGGGAGIQADIKASEYHGTFMTTAITAITAQNTQGVQGIVALEPSFVQKQINSVLEDFDVKAIKIGMLGNIKLIEAVKESIQNLNIPIVLDPVAVSRAGFKLIEDDAIQSLKTIFKYVELITPNKYEAKEFFEVQNLEDIKTCNNFGTNILFKNMSNEENKTVDILKTKNGEIKYFKSKKAEESNTHGTGCSYSASIASLLAKDKKLEEAIKLSKEYIYEAIKKTPNIGLGNGPINHSLK